MSKHYIYTYRLTDFTGFAPCYENNLLSLAICKSDMRRVIGSNYDNNPSDTFWFMGLVSNSLVYNYSYFSCDKPGRVLFVAKINRIETYEEYFTKEEYKNRKDQIYENCENGQYYTKGSKKRFRHVLDCDVHDCKEDQDRDWDKRHSSKENYVLLSTEYAFLDCKSGIELEKTLLINEIDIPARQGHRCTIKDSIDDIIFLDNIVSQASTTHNLEVLPKDIQFT